MNRTPTLTLLALALALAGCIGETLTEAPGETTQTTTTFDRAATVSFIDALVKRRRYMESQRDDTSLAQSRRDEMAQLIAIEDAMLDKYFNRLLSHGVLVKVDLTLPDTAEAMNTVPTARQESAYSADRPGIVTAAPTTRPEP